MTEFGRQAASPRYASIRLSAFILLLLVVLPGLALAQGPWTRTKFAPPFGIDTSLVLTDGTVMCHQGFSDLWCLLTPDSTGSYANGRWSLLPSLPPGYSPLYYASAVLADGRMAMIGGEYNDGFEAFTNLGAIYNPVANSWANLPGPATWPNIGDAQCVVLPDGRFMLANPLSDETAFLDPKTLKWSKPAAKNKNDDNDEEGWTLLPDGRVLTVDVNSLDSEIFDPKLNKGDGLWSLAGLTPVQLADVGTDEEMGPQILRPDNTVICFGATGHNAVYHVATGLWSLAPDFPLLGGVQLDCADAPASILADGNVLVVTSPGLFLPPAKFFVWNGATFAAVPDLPNGANNPSFVYRMVVLPTGEVMVTDGTDDVEIYTAHNKALAAWKPTISRSPTIVPAGQTFKIIGTQFNGLTCGAHYGDDAASATNYPLVRLTSHADGSVVYQRTHDHSTMAVATGGAPVFTFFDASDDLVNGDYDLQVVANGIASDPVKVTVKGGNLLVNPHFEQGPGLGWTASHYVIDNDTFEPPHNGSWKAWLCGYGIPHMDTLAQIVTIPANVTSVKFSFWLHIDTQDSSQVSRHDNLQVQVRTMDTATTLASFSNLNASNGYTKYSFNLTQFKGQKIQIVVTGMEDGHYVTSFVLDDFTLVAN